MRVSIYGVLDDLRDTALDKRDKGELFEKLVKAFLNTDPEWQQRFSEVERWTDWQHREGVRDIGIDLVAKNRYDDGWSAIQCKFYDAGEKVAKSDIDVERSSIPARGGVLAKLSVGRWGDAVGRLGVFVNA